MAMRGLPSWVKVLLFTSSYAPLYLVIGFKTATVSYTLFGFNLPRYPILGSSISLLSISLFIISILSVAFLLFVLRIHRTQEGERIDIDHYENRADLVSEYILVYIFPFAVLDYTQISNLLSFAVLFLTVGALQIRSSRLHINPVLAAFRYDVYRIQVGGDDILLLTKGQLNGEEVSVKTTPISRDVVLMTKQ